MSITRLAPITRWQGQCAACRKEVAGAHIAIRIYGELFHRSCAPLHARAPKERRPADVA